MAKDSRIGIRECAELIGMPVATLRGIRSRGFGPPATKGPNGRLLFDPREARQWRKSYGPSKVGRPAAETRNTRAMLLMTKKAA